MSRVHFSFEFMSTMTILPVEELLRGMLEVSDPLGPAVQRSESQKVFSESHASWLWRMWLIQ